MNLTQAKSISGSLGKPSKMPGQSYGLSAHDCNVGSKLAKIAGSVCFGCYALKANYQYPSVMTAHKKRASNLGSPEWVEAMIVQIKHSKTKYFRWHDSGDLQSFEHLVAICKIARALPKVNFWIPTRENALVRKYLSLGSFPDNLTVRVSGQMIDGVMPSGFDHISMVSATGTVYGKECRAYTRNNKCSTCRACWSKEVRCVTYHKH